MKIPCHMAIPLLMITAKALAFQAADSRAPNPRLSQWHDSAPVMFPAELRQPKALGPSVFYGVCQAITPAGCSCAFCMSLRQQA